MKYKALMLDIDGTLIPYNYDSLPTKKVSEAVRKAQNKLHVCLVTGRSYTSRVREILKRLSLHSGYAVLTLGAHVLDISTKELIYDKSIEIKDAEAITELFFKENVVFYLKQEVYGHVFKKRNFTKGDKIIKPYMFYTGETLTLKKTEKILRELSYLPRVSAYKGVHKHPNKFHVVVTHAEATKLHGIGAIMKKLRITKDEIIGIGDGYNDFPLLMASGLKIVMENGIDELKEIADYIAPPVSRDGVATAIERFVLI